MRIAWYVDSYGCSSNRRYLTKNVLDFIERNPVGVIREMDFNMRFKWRPYNQARALQVLSHGTMPSVEGRTENGLHPFFEGLIGFAGGELRVILTIEDVYVSNCEVVFGELVPYMRQMTQLLPGHLEAKADADWQAGETRCKLGLPELPASLGYSVHWYYLLDSEHYSKDYTRETLLAAPAYSVHEPGPGRIELICYEDPLSFAQPETQQRIIELTRYLDTHGLDRQPS